MKKIYLLIFLLLLDTAIYAQNVSYTPLFSNDIFNRNLTANTTVGSTSGVGSVSANGAATYSIPVVTPLGTNGVVPQISLEYSSMSGSNALGLGWNVSGLSAITRAPRSVFYDNSANPVELATNDRFALDGQRLIVKTGDYGTDNSVYGTENESFANVNAHGGDGIIGIAYFEMVTKDGVLMEYGKTIDSRFMDISGTKVVFWRLNKITNPDGNYIEFKYTNQDRDPRIDEINYTGNVAQGLAPYNKIKFEYKIRNDQNVIYEAGSSVASKYLLDKITVTTESATLVKRYQLNYGWDNINSYLKEVSETGSDGVSAFNSTVFKYGDAPESFLKETGPTLPAGTEYFSGDFDGNGKSDIAVAHFTLYQIPNQVNQGKKFTGFSIYRDGNPNNATAVTSLVDGSQINNVQYRGNSNSSITSDFNGDGLDDILTTSISLDQVRNKNFLSGIVVYRSNLSPDGMLSNQLGFVGSSLPASISNYKYIPVNGNYIINGDFDGDGIQDVITILQGIDSPQHNAIYYKLYSAGNYLFDFFNVVRDADNSLLGNTLAAAKKIFVLDFNGDGKDDIMTLTEGNLCEIYSGVNSSSQGYSFKLLYSSTTLFKDTDDGFYLGDFNGDGKTDVLYELTEGREHLNMPWKKAYSTGTGFEIRDFNFQNYNGGFVNKDLIRIADFNGDGKSDVYHQYLTTATQQPPGSDIYYSTNNGEYYQHFTPQSEADVINFSSVPFDLNGDGRAEIVARRNGATNLDVYSFKKSGIENLLEKVENGVGHVTTWSYKSLVEGGSFYNRGAVKLDDYPLNNIQLPVSVVSNFNNQDDVSGQITQYTYEQGKLHRSGKGFLGFAKKIALDIVTGYKTISEYEFNTSYYITLPKKTSIYYNADNTLIGQTTLTNEVVNTASKRYWIKTTGVQNISLGGAVSNTTNIYDDYGNVTQSTVNNNNVETTTTSSLYEAHPGTIPNKATSVTVSNTRTGESQYSTTTKFGYNNIGQLESKTDFFGLEKSIGTSYEYYPLGNLKKTTITPTGPDAPAARSSSAVYDPKGRYPETNINVLNQSSSATYDPRWGKPLTATGVDGLITSWQYDVFGRTKKTTLPEGYSVDETYNWGLTDNTAWYLNTVHPGKPTVKAWYDKLGRNVKTESEAFDGQWITQTKSYNNKGNLTSSTQPYKSGEDIVTATSIYDEYNRPTQLSTSISALAGTVNLTYNYNSGTLTTTKTRLGTSAAGNQVSSSVTDASGKVIGITDAGGTLNYTYYSHGGLKEVKNAGSTLITNEYDSYGRQTKLVDQNAGTTQYLYNILGELSRQTSAKGEQHNMLYDLMGRTINRSGPEGTTGYEFYPSGSGASSNQMKKITGFAGNLQEFTYDGYGRVNTLKETVNDVAHTTTYQHNSNGDVTSTSYTPSGFGTNYNYNERGFLTTIKNANNSVTIYTNSGVNGRGQVTNYSLGNNQSSVNTYVYGFPTKFETAGKQNLSMNWTYGLGMLNSRSDAIKGKTESFVHDNLDRLKTSTIGSAVFTTNYADNGNISNKTDAGIYNYHPTKPNAVIGVTNSTPSTISLQQQDITYTSFMQPEKVTESKPTGGTPYDLTYTYGADYNRVKSELKQGANLLNTRYYFGDFEKDVTGSSTKFIHYISSPAGLVAIVIREAGSDTYNYVYTDHLGSILTVTDKDGTIVAEQNFDAWGRRRNPSTWDLLPPTEPTPLVWLTRGYTGHEHLDKFGLINMNGRMYDPVVGRMLSADNLVPDATSTQGFNRYSYAFNSPLIYTDPDGQNPFIIGAIIGGVVNLFNNWDKVKGQPLVAIAYFGNGAIGGAMSVMNPIGAGAITSGLNIGTDIFTGNLPKFNDGYDAAAYLFGKVMSGIAVSSAGPMGKQIYNQAAGVLGKLPWRYRWANVGGGDLVMEGGYVQGAETNTRVLIEEASTGAGKSLSDLSFSELQALNRANSAEMNAFFKSNGEVVPGRAILETYKELTMRIINTTGGASAAKATEAAIKVQSARLIQVTEALKIMK